MYIHMLLEVKQTFAGQRVCMFRRCYSSGKAAVRAREERETVVGKGKGGQRQILIVAIFANELDTRCE